MGAPGHVTGVAHTVVDDLAELDESVRRAARAHLAEDPKAMLAELEDMQILLADVVADVRRSLEAA